MVVLRGLLLGAAVLVVGLALGFGLGQVMSRLQTPDSSAKADTALEKHGPVRLPAGSHAAPAQRTPADPVAVETVFALNCAPCHGARGEGRFAYSAPALAGQPGWYVAQQLRNFKDGIRGTHPEDIQGLQMAPITRLLADEVSMDRLAAHIAGLETFDTAATLDGNADAGASLFTGTCLPCHGENGEGNPLLKAPRLAGQADWYLFRQLTKFRKGIRGSHAGDPLGMQMAAMAMTLVDEQAMADLVAYINGLNRMVQTAASGDGPGQDLGHAPRGAALFALNCAPCHQANAEGQAAFRAPALAGQRDEYLALQLRKFREGVRGGHAEDVEGMMMAPIMRLLPEDQDVQDIVAHVSSMKPFETASTLEGDAERGATFYQGTCLPCHGQRGEGHPLLKAPRLAGQADWYLVRQLTKFKRGVRGAHAEDSEGMQMAAMAKTLMDEQMISDVAAYINGLR